MIVWFVAHGNLLFFDLELQFSFCLLSCWSFRCHRVVSENFTHVVQ